jgi:hypothetical protein
MDPVAESEMVVVPPVEVEAVGIGKPRRVAIHRAHEHGLAAADSLSPEGYVCLRLAPVTLHRGLVAEQLVDAALEQFRVGP